LPLIQEDQDDVENMIESTTPEVIPEGIEVFQINGPFFFGATTLLNDVLNRIQVQSHTFILRMHNVPFIDASGARALEEFLLRCEKIGIAVVLVGAQEQPIRVMKQMHLLNKVRIARSLRAALNISNDMATT
jgi:SulP family sulfate permease